MFPLHLQSREFFSWFLSVVERQRDGECRSFPFGAFELNRSAVQRDAALHDHKPQTCAGNLTDVASAMKSLEKPRLIGQRNSAAAIHDAKNRVLATTRDVQVHRLARFRILYRVRKQVREDVAKNCFVTARDLSVAIAI